MAQGIVIAVDAMGGDNAPQVVLDGCSDALAADPELSIMLVGPAQVVEPFAARHDRCEAVIATEVIAMGEHPALAVRKKKDSSLVVAARLVKEGKAQGFFSAGSTGACLAAATLIVGRVKGIARPALATIVPCPAKPVMLCDVGANADCKPEYLVQFAQMATIYMEQVMGVQNPTVAQLNIGEEDAKGSTFAQESFAALRALPNFVGNGEGCDILAAKYDIFVTDGFTGNVCLKTIEGTAKVLLKEIKKTMTSSTKNKLAAAVLQNDVRALASTLSADTYGGAPLLGVKAACLVGHGSSNARAVCNGVAFTADIARHRVPERIGQAILAAKAEEESHVDKESAVHESGFAQ